MRSIGTIPPTLDAERFSDFLHAQGMPNMVEETAPGEKWLVWVDNDDHLERAKGELDAFLANPEDSKYAGASKAANALRQQQSKKEQKWRKRFVDVRTSWGSAKQWNCPVTIALMAISILIGFITRAGDGPPMERVGQYLWFADGGQTSAEGERVYLRAASRAAAFEEIRRGQVWRLITPIFIHYGIIHLLFNMFWLRDLGAMIEVQRSSRFLLLLVLATAVLSNVGHVLWDPQGVHLGGMSGVVYGLFGYTWMKDKFEPYLGLHVSQQTVTIMLAWLVFCMVGEGILGPVANAAHVVGLVVGVVAGYAPTGWRRLKRQVQR